jgi:predicted transcriptional regulator
MDDPLSLESRNRIFEFISKRPGTHVREMERDLAMPPGNLSYHLDVLSKENLIRSEDDGYRLRYFPARGFIQKNRQILSLLRQEQLRKILLIVLSHGKPSFHTIQVEMGLSKSTISYHIKKLVNNNALKVEKAGREFLYMAIDPEFLRNSLVMIDGGSDSRFEDRFTRIWKEIRPPSADRTKSSYLDLVQNCQDDDGDHPELKGY